ncbi:hypothetical protein T492DRAFT_985263, partial [Pavlovales sp. CCMP2436]
MYNARVVTIIPADSYAFPDLNKEYDSHDSSTTSCANAEPDFSCASIVAVADANPSVILTDVMQPAADKTYTLFGLAKFTLLLMFTLLAAAPFLHKMQTAPLASARFDALAAAPFLHKVQPAPLALARFDALAAAPPLHEPLHEVQTALLASTRTDALAAAPLLHKVQSAPSASTRTDALAATPPLHKVQTGPPASARADTLAASSPLHFMLNPISVNLDDPGSTEEGEDDAASTPALALVTTTSTPALVTSRSSSRILHSPFAANAPKEDYNQHAFALLALVAELRDRTGTLTLQTRAATNLPHSLASQHGADRRQLHRLPAAVDIFTGKTCRYHHRQGADRRQLHRLPAAVDIFTGKTCRHHRCFPLRQEG